MRVNRTFICKVLIFLVFLCERTNVSHTFFHSNFRYFRCCIKNFFMFWTDIIKCYLMCPSKWDTSIIYCTSFHSARVQSSDYTKLISWHFSQHFIFRVVGLIHMHINQKYWDSDELFNTLSNKSILLQCLIHLKAKSYRFDGYLKECNYSSF